MPPRGLIPTYQITKIRRWTLNQNPNILTHWSVAQVGLTTNWRSKISLSCLLPTSGKRRLLFAFVKGIYRLFLIEFIMKKRCCQIVTSGFRRMYCSALSINKLFKDTFCFLCFYLQKHVSPLRDFTEFVALQYSVHVQPVLTVAQVVQLQWRELVFPTSVGPV